MPVRVVDPAQRRQVSARCPRRSPAGLLLRAGWARGHATGRLSVPSVSTIGWPPTELADGFGREEALPALEPGSRAGFTPVLRWVPGSPCGRLGGVRRGPPCLGSECLPDAATVTVVIES